MTSHRQRFLAFLCSAAVATSCSSDDDSDDTGAEEHGEHDHDHGADTGADHDHGAEGHDHSVDTDADDPVVAYCMCMLVSCHEPYHMKWGEDEMQAEQGCLMEAQGVPSNGGPTEMGDFLECRQHFCDAAATDPTVCTNALGDMVCM